MRSVLVALVCAGAALVAQPAQAEAIPTPDKDPFYAVPSGIADLPNGKILKSRRVSVNAYGLPLPVEAWQVQYKSLDGKNQPIADVTTVMVPEKDWTGGGERPLLSYQVAEDSVGRKCAPSYGLRAGLLGGLNNGALESALMVPALVKGWAVAVPDYQGPREAFLGGRQSGHAVLDGIRAARAFSPAGLADAPIGLTGYSGGAFATSHAAQLQPSYAPDLKFAGVALGGIVASIKATTKAFDGTPVGGAIIIGIIGMDRNHPEMDLQQHLNAKGKQAFAASQEDCITDAVLRHPFLSIKDHEAVPNVLDLPHLTQMMLNNSPLGNPGTPSAPVYAYHTIFDELAPIGPARELFIRFCKAGVRVQKKERLLGEHLTEVVAGAPGALSYLADRYAGKPAPSNCP